MEISVVIPAYNEAENILPLYRRIKSVMEDLQVPDYELIFVNDGSQDKTIEELAALSLADVRVKFLHFSRNFGHQVAVTAGLDFARGASVVIIDADLQDPPELIVDLYRKKQEGYQVVYAKRRQRKGESWLKLLTAKVFYRILAQITAVAIPVDTGDFRIIDRRIVEILRQMPERNKFLRGQIAWIGFRQTFVEYDRNSRNEGSSGYSYRKMFRFALDGITSFSNVPLKIASLMGFAVSGIAFLLIIYTIYARLIAHDYVAGWASMMISVLFIGGIQLIAIGIIGEYLSRFGADIRQRPPYIVAQTNIEQADSR